MKLSIILPVYNVEKFIPDCLDSLETQDLPKEEYEIICVDDGSPDNAVQVIEEYQKKYPNIRLIRQGNSGVCAARNNGFKLATGEYVWFIDPDDFIQANCLGLMLDKLYAAKADFLVFEYDEVNENSTFDKDVQLDIIIKEQEGYDSKGSACQYICRRTYLEEHSISFNDDLAYGEDYLWAFQINYRKHVGVLTDAAIYHYRQRIGSAMHGRNKEKQLRHMNDMHRLALIYGEEYERCQREELPKSILKEVKRRQALCIQSVLLDAVRYFKDKKEFLDLLKEMQCEGVYPYRWLWWHLFSSKIKCPLRVRILVLPFPMKWYVCCLNWVFRIIRKN